MKVHYEEKTYESYFNNELSIRSEIYFPPGQVLEGILGFDAAAYSKNRKLWRILGYPFWFYPNFSGVNIEKVAIYLENALGDVINSIPAIKTNLLFQYKRPEYITTANGKEWNHWNEPYFRYNIYKEQQDILEKIEKKFGSQALVLYASPAIKDLTELIKLKKRKKIIESSNFKKPQELSAHNRNTYLKSGMYSIACSEPEKINNLDLMTYMENIEFTNVEPHQLIVKFAKYSSQLLENSIFQREYLELSSEYDSLREFELLHSHMVMKSFREITGIQWLTLIKA